jgi:hypothetical protein
MKNNHFQLPANTKIVMTENSVFKDFDCCITGEFFELDTLAFDLMDSNGKSLGVVKPEVALELGFTTTPELLKRLSYSISEEALLNRPKGEGEALSF